MIAGACVRAGAGNRPAGGRVSMNTGAAIAYTPVEQQVKRLSRR